jgi:hypothetical protein
MSKYISTQAAEDVAEDRLNTLTLESTEMEIIEAIAEWLTARKPPYHLSIFHDAGPRAEKRALRNLQEAKKGHRNIESAHHWVFTTGKCIAVPFDWSRKGQVGITTKDRDYARHWITTATYFGYCVYRDIGGIGNVAVVREQIRERNARGKTGLYGH